MIGVDYPCDKCKHKLPNIDGWKCVCKAFPNGIPNDLLLTGNVVNLSECNNGIGFEPKEQNIK